MTKRKQSKLSVRSSGFYTMARHNLGGVKRILATMPDERERNSDPCIQFLLGWSCEGYLKTFLAAKKMSDGELKAKIGHDLIEAFEVATAEGLDYPEIGRLHIVIRHLAPGHLDMHWRYMPTNADGSERQFNLVWPSLAIPALDALDRAVWPWVQTDFGKTLGANGLRQDTRGARIAAAPRLAAGVGIGFVRSASRGRQQPFDGEFHGWGAGSNGTESSIQTTRLVATADSAPSSQQHSPMPSGCPGS